MVVNPSNCSATASCAGLEWGLRALWDAHPLLPELQRLQSLPQGEALCGHRFTRVLHGIDSRRSLCILCSSLPAHSTSPSVYGGPQHTLQACAHAPWRPGVRHDNIRSSCALIW